MSTPFLWLPGSFCRLVELVNLSHLSQICKFRDVIIIEVDSGSFNRIGKMLGDIRRCNGRVRRDFNDDKGPCCWENTESAK